jgi:hypothetical protein
MLMRDQFTFTADVGARLASGGYAEGNLMS